jgi:DNA processing protein
VTAPERETCLIRISLALGLARRPARELLLSLKDPALILDEDTLSRPGLFEEALRKVRGVDPGRVQSMRDTLSKRAVRIVSILDEDYPPLLARTEDPPAILFVMGKMSLLREPSICIVGSRIATAEGLGIARQLAEELSREGLLVVSGLAKGIDRAAHQGALRSGGKTAAVLGCGPDIVYPRECKREYDEVSREGAIVSELPPGTRPMRCFFPRRNQIMSGMSMGVVVVEAAARSGALITAHSALEEGREVFAVPGSPANPLSRGPNALIKQGATPVETGQDVMEALRFWGWLWDDAPVAWQGHDLLTFLEGGSRTLDELSRLTGKNVSHLLAGLVEMEVAGKVRRMPGMRFGLVR